MARKKQQDNEPETKTVRGIGDNSDGVEIEGKKLKGFVDHIEKLNAKKDQILQEIGEVYANCKAIGYDGRTIRTIVRERKMEPEKRKEQAELLNLYRAALGMLDDE